MAEKKGLKECPFCTREVEEGLQKCPYCNRIFRLAADIRNDEGNELIKAKKESGKRTAVIFLISLSAVVFLVLFFFYFRGRDEPAKDILQRELAGQEVGDTEKLSEEVTELKVLKEDDSGEEEKNPEAETGMEDDEEISSPFRSETGEQEILADESKYSDKDLPGDTKEEEETGSLNAFDYYRRGMKSRNEGKLEMAREEFHKSISIDPGIAWAHYGLGTVYVHLGMDEEAISEFNNALKFNPKIAFAHYHLGKIYQKNEDLDRAVEEFKKTVKLDNSFLWAHYRLGEIYKKQEKNEEAEKEFQIYKSMMETDSLITE